MSYICIIFQLKFLTKRDELGGNPIHERSATGQICFSPCFYFSFLFFPRISRYFFSDNLVEKNETTQCCEFAAVKRLKLYNDASPPVNSYLKILYFVKINSAFRISLEFTLINSYRTLILFQ